MASNNVLENSGILYGANFDEWKKRTMTILHLQGLAYTVRANEVNDIISLDAEHSEDSARAANFICLLVSPDIMKRVPASERNNAGLLMNRLEDMTSYFRFTSLPPELRNRIYGYVLSSCDRYVLKSNEEHVAADTSPTGYPAITKASQQIRGEALPIFYSTSYFKLFFKSVQSLETADAKSWFIKVVGNNAKNLRSVSVSVPIYQLPLMNTNPTVMNMPILCPNGRILIDVNAVPSTSLNPNQVAQINSLRNGRSLDNEEPLTTRVNIRFSCHPDNGLLVHYPPKLVAESKTQLVRHTKTIRAGSKLMGDVCDSRQLFLALFANESLWQSLTLNP